MVWIRVHRPAIAAMAIGLLVVLTASDVCLLVQQVQGIWAKRSMLIF